MLETKRKISQNLKKLIFSILLLNISCNQTSGNRLLEEFLLSKNIFNGAVVFLRNDACNYCGYKILEMAVNKNYEMTIVLDSTTFLNYSSDISTANVAIVALDNDSLSRSFFTKDLGHTLCKIESGELRMTKVLTPENVDSIFFYIKQ